MKGMRIYAGFVLLAALSAAVPADGAHGNLRDRAGDWVWTPGVARAGVRVTALPRGMVIRDSLRTLRVEAVTDRILHVTVSPDSAYRSASLAVGPLPAEGPRVRIRPGKGRMSLLTAALEARYDYRTGTFCVVDSRRGGYLVREPLAGARRFSPSDAPDGGWRVEQRFVLAPDEGIYGLGQYQEGVWNYRGHRVNLVQANKEIVNPVLVSDRGYGILWDNYSKTVADNTRGDTLSIVSEAGGAADYYVIAGGDMDGVVAGYRTLTGAAPMFPRSFFGFWQSKERYKSFDELTGVVEEYRRRRIPIDNIVLDWSYWGDKAHWNSMRFAPDSFPDPESAIGRLHDELKVKLTVSVWPGVGPATAVYRDMERADVLFDEPTWAGYKVVDMFDPRAQEIFWRHLRGGLYSKGVDGWWLDATEPSFRDGFTQQGQEARSKSAGMTAIGSFHRWLNAYSLAMTRTVYDRLRATGDNRRVQILTRSAFASQQRYATALWSGDVSASWETFRRQLPAGLNLSLSGIPYWTSDIGGFFVNERGGEYPRGLDDPAYRELYVRWFQHGAFTPLFRAHGTNVPREVWQFGKPGEPAYEAQVAMIRLRYSLLPYIYSTAWRVTRDGYTMMRPLVMDFPHDPHAAASSDAYLFGPSILVRPVTEPMYADSLGVRENPDTRVRVWLPGGRGPQRELWFDMNDPQRVYDGGRRITCDAPLTRLPLFVRGGSVIPTIPPVQHTGERPGELILTVWGGRDASFTLYGDDGESYDYEKGACATVPVHWNDRSGLLTLGARQGSYPGMEARIRLRVIVHRPVRVKGAWKVETVERTAEYTGTELKLRPLKGR